MTNQPVALEFHPNISPITARGPEMNDASICGAGIARHELVNPPVRCRCDSCELRLPIARAATLTFECLSCFGERQLLGEKSRLCGNLENVLAVNARLVDAVDNIRYRDGAYEQGANCNELGRALFHETLNSAEYVLGRSLHLNRCAIDSAPLYVNLHRKNVTPIRVRQPIAECCAQLLGGNQNNLFISENKASALETRMRNTRPNNPRSPNAAAMVRNS
jgi:hypothetical protein